MDAGTNVQDLGFVCGFIFPLLFLFFPLFSSYRYLYRAEDPVHDEA
jgi:hypothetical protein